MGEVIEHEDNTGTPPPVRIGDTGLLVPIKVYQDVYHQITGRTEQIRKRYSENLLIEFSEVDQLHHKILQLCDIYNIVAKNETVSVFHEKERKEQFTSFERFRAYNASTPTPTVTVVLKYSFSIIPSGLDKPQEYVVNIRLTSRVAMLKQLEADAPAFMRGHLIAAMAKNTAEITVDYVDYVIARGFVEAFDEWIRGCNTHPSPRFINRVQSQSHLIPKGMTLALAAMTIYFALITANSTAFESGDPQLWARFFIFFGGGFYFLTNLAGTAGRMIENAVDSHTSISYLNLNKGDRKLVDEFGKQSVKKWTKFIAGCILTIALGVMSSKIAEIL